MDETAKKIILIIGANSGIGKQTAIGLARLNKHVVMVVRNMEREEQAKSEVVGKTGNKSIDLRYCDLSSMSMIRRFAKEFIDDYQRLDVLVNNAGAVFNKRSTTQDGYERTFAVDYLGPFLLTHELLPKLKKEASSRIINISSGLHKNATLNMEDLQSEESYKGMNAYSHSKLLLIMFTYELARRLQGSGITANVALPGFVATNLGNNSDSLLSNVMFKMVRPMQISAERGATTSIYLASSSEVDGKTGGCYERGKEGKSSPQSYNQANQSKLWEKTNNILGLNPEW
jgi:retinol dehydrogenase 14